MVGKVNDQLSFDLRDVDEGEADDVCIDAKSNVVFFIDRSTAKFRADAIKRVEKSGIFSLPTMEFRTR